MLIGARMTLMLDAKLMAQLRRAVMEEDWPNAGDVYIELTLAARGPIDRFRVNALRPYLGLRDWATVLALLEGLRHAGRENRRSSGPDNRRAERRKYY
jgi:hypothetical protein